MARKESHAGQAKSASRKRANQAKYGGGRARIVPGDGGRTVSFGRDQAAISHAFKALERRSYYDD